MKAPWITYRPEIKVLDCTIRDGGLINEHLFEDGLVRATYQACVAAGIDYMEIGYKNSERILGRDGYGAWRFCREDDIRRIVGDNPTELKISAMIDAGKSDWRDVCPKKDSVVDLLRVACYINQIPEAIDMIKDAYQKGYEVTCNIMAISVAQEAEIDQALEVVAQTPASTIVVVDSNGALYTEQIERLVKKYIKAVKPLGKEVGIHAHNNQQLAFANTIEAIIHGANRCDASMAGLGRGAGNCPMELLLGFLRNPKFDIRPVWQVVEEHFVPLSRVMEWGPLPPYIIGGQFNQHPREAMAWRASERKDKIVEFYNHTLGEN